MMESQYYIILLSSLLLSAFFSGIEIAYISSDKLHLLIDNQKNNFLSKTLAYITNKPALFIATTLVGNTISIFLYGSSFVKAMEPVLSTFPPFLVLILQTIISTAFVLVLAEFLPKSLSMANPNKVLTILAVPFSIIYTVLYIPVYLIVQLSKLVIVYVFKWKYEDDKPLIALTDLNNFVQRLESLTISDGDSDLAELNKEIFDNVINFRDVKVRDCLIPRKEIIAVDIEEGLEELKSAFVTSGHSKVFIYKNTIDNIIGYCHSTKLFKKPETVQEMMSDLIIVPETELANDVLIKFIEKRKSIALVVDEFGGTSGIVSLEDIIEEIFGEIQDEHDSENLIEQKISEGVYIFSARQEINHLNDKYELNIAEGEYDTLGGFMLHHFEDIPKVNQMIEIEGLECTVIARDNTRIDRVKVRVKK